MRLAGRLNSFPVIAGAALFLAALLGFGLGMLGSGAGVVPSAPDALASADDGKSSGGPLKTPENTRSPKANRGGSNDNPRGNGRDTGRPKGNNDNGRTDTGTDTTRKTGIGEPRVLPEGRTDAIETVETVEESNGVIQVTLSDIRGARLPWALLALDVDAGPLGWHAVPMQPQNVQGERGLFEFTGLHAGEYRIRSLATNYVQVEETVRLLRGDSIEAVDIVLQPLGVATVEFFVKLSNGDIPEEVELRITKGEQEDTNTQGRFGEHDAPANTSMAVIPPTRYRQRTSPGGMVKLTLSTGLRTAIVFTASNDDGTWRGEAAVIPQEGTNQVDVELVPTELPADEPYSGGQKLGRVDITLTLKGKVIEFTRVNLRKSIDDFQFRAANSNAENVYTWENVFTGKWFLVAESNEFHAPFVKEIEVGTAEKQSFDITTGHLRVVANREAGSPDPENGEARYRVRLRPMGSGTIERAFNGNLTGKDSDHIDFFVPAGIYDVRVESPENYAKLAVAPVEQSLTMADGGDVEIDFTLSAAATLKFRCVDGAAQPIANAEYLISFHPAGSVPETETENVEKGAYDGVCETTSAPFGAVYVHIWTTSTDWNNPDKVFQLDLPAYGTKDLGAVVVAP